MLSSTWVRRRQTQWTLCFLLTAAQGCLAVHAQTAAPALPPAPDQGSLHGTVEDSSGDVLLGATVTLHLEGQPDQSIQSSANGEFLFAELPAGAFTLSVAAGPSFSTTELHGTLAPGEQKEMAGVVLPLATTSAAVTVSVSREELGAEEVRAEEKQRVLGAIPNYLVTYDWHAVSLTPKQKFTLAWKSTIDVVSIGITAGIAGAQQADGALAGYGQGAQGYFKRFGADYANLSIGTMLGSAALPIVFRQDPRYFYKGSGSIDSRILYAISTTVMCRSDSGRWEPNYSNILASLAAGGISNLYYPASSRGSASVTIENGLIGLASGAADALFQEFLVRKLTPHLPPARTADNSPTPP